MPVNLVFLLQYALGISYVDFMMQNALEPHMSRTTFEYHWGKHHRAYVDNLNKQIVGTELDELTLEDIILITYNKGNLLPPFNNAAQVRDRQVDPSTPSPFVTLFQVQCLFWKFHFSICLECSWNEILHCTFLFYNRSKCIPIKLYGCSVVCITLGVGNNMEVYQ